ncbi:MAG: restriction endonuclease [Ignavibacterium sp.]|jgi:restriction system protein|nr:MAG: restriction endonuclease [Ignavibacterium sp.]MDX9711773.1 restriction endonuclease [Ignavibacteriaceae bacterium]
MSENLIQIGHIETRYSSNTWNPRLLGYQVTIYHSGLKEHRLLSAPEKYLLESKVNLQIQKWKDRWNREVSSEEANLRTDEAKQAIEEIDKLLSHTLSVDDTIQWHKLKDRKRFTEKSPKEYLEGILSNLTKPVKGYLKPIPSISEVKLPSKPDINSIRYMAQLSFIDKLFPAKRRKKEQIKKDEYKRECLKWEEGCKQINLDYDNLCKEVEQHNKKIESDFKNETDSYEKLKKHHIEENQKLVEEWEKRKTEFYKQQEEYNSKIDRLKEAYFNQSAEAIAEYCERVLINSEYPDSFPQKFEIDYNPTNKILIVEYELPSIECFPKIKDVKYIAARKELKETFISDSQLNKMFDDAMYKITLRTIHELFEADKANALDAISFNGWVNAINKATGKTENNCIVSIQVKKEEFLEIDLSKIDPKTCFKNLKGVAGSKLSALTPIQPILQISRVDKRFVDGYNVTGQIDNSTNLAAMDWEDFEHLIRELFEKEFQSNGGEVKVTQASRDGGVDAIAFDPDPIRGGKIVIQAKRYTNTVGVSAVRDLYGTVVNEGATKGILVSTADYGPDAYEFAKGKPLTLLNGSNLLHLLEKHGHHAKIDLKEAKKILSENKDAL